MILEVIFTWVGGLFLISLALFGLVILWFWLYEKIWYNSIISVKSLFWHFAGEFLEKKGKESNSQLKLKLGTRYYTRLRNKRYEWRCIKIEAIK